MDTFKLDKILSVRKGPQGKWVFEVTFQGLKGVNHVPFAVMKILYDKVRFRTRQGNRKSAH